MAKVKILAISNELSLQQLLLEDLNGGEYEVTITHHTGPDFRDDLYRERPDFIILDIMMPNLEGIETCLTIRQWTQTPILMLSTWGAEKGEVRGLNLGSDDYLTAPFSINALKRRINETLKRNSTAVTDRKV